MFLKKGRYCLLKLVLLINCVLGAQVSILSESCAKRCEISRLIDERFQATARGVGGSQKFLGRIHSCMFLAFFSKFVM